MLRNSLTIILTFFLRLCTPLNATNTNDVANLFESLIGMFEDVVQYNNDNREFEGIVSNVTIDTLCNYMTSNSGRLYRQDLISKH